MTSQDSPARVAAMSQTTARPAPVSSAPAGDRRSGRGVVLALGVTVTAVSFIALLGLLAAYFFSWPAVPALYALALFGLPVGFALMVLHVVLGAVRRSRL